ncbi:hypothetical protein DEO72_LG4g79 [Vigna unguiculata]|uniref:Uncharacterized protein n=1 Tax=Vigna unguiculata TaxID=3917 RepID=A0A4D6LKP8_VIGUN|nr:hypothetical protein DEO72_LG4g79 [Vigna unguiculata]
MLSRRGVRFDSACHLYPIAVPFDRLGQCCSNGAFEKAHPLIEQARFGSRKEHRVCHLYPIGVLFDRFGRSVGIGKQFLAVIVKSYRGVPFDSACHLYPIRVSFDRLGRCCSNGALEKAHPLIEQAWFGSRREPRSAYRPIGLSALKSYF